MLRTAILTTMACAAWVFVEIAYRWTTPAIIEFALAWSAIFASFLLAARFRAARLNEEPAKSADVDGARDAPIAPWDNQINDMFDIERVPEPTAKKSPR